MPFQGAVQGPSCIAVDTEQEHSAGGPVESVDVVDTLADLVAQYFHGDQVALFGFISGMNQMAGWLVDSNKPLVLIKDIEWLVG